MAGTGSGPSLDWPRTWAVFARELGVMPMTNSWEVLACASRCRNLVASIARYFG